LPRDPQRRLSDDGAQPENVPALALEEVGEAVNKQDATDTDWLSMTTADPAFFLKDTGPE